MCVTCHAELRAFNCTNSFVLFFFCQKPEEARAMVARLYLVKVVQLVLNNGLTMLTMTPLEKM